MSKAKLTDLTLSLAGIVQATCLIQELARHGSANDDATTISLNSITKLESDNVVAIFGNLHGLKLGLTELHKLLLNPTNEHKKDLLRYIVSVLVISKRLLHSPEALQKLRQNLENVKRQIDYFSPQHEMILSNLADAYSEIQTHIKQRIMILGKEQYLTTADIQNKIRALLLAAVRSAVLWRQLGGSRWQLFFYRKKLIKTCEELIQKL